MLVYNDTTSNLIQEGGVLKAEKRNEIPYYPYEFDDDTSTADFILFSLANCHLQLDAQFYGRFAAERKPQQPALSYGATVSQMEFGRAKA